MSKPTKPRKARGAKPAAEPSSTVSRFQAFTVETVHRSALKSAPYNPRYITERAKAKLRDVLGRVGLVQPIVWNKRTGNIVGGHQRISQIDALEGKADYCLTVAVVDVDEKRERELNVLLNNANVTGDWDFERLKEVLTQPDIDILNAGFDQADMMKMLGEAPSQGPAEHQDKLAKQLEDIKKSFEKLSETSRHKDDTDFYSVVVFGSHSERQEFLAEFGFEDNRYLDGRTLGKVLRNLKETKLAADGAEGQGPGVGQDKSELTTEPRAAGA